MKTEPPDTNPPRWKITLVDRTKFFRRPRTKRRRVLKKWYCRPENHRPLMVPVGVQIIMGAGCLAQNIKPDPYWNEKDPSRPRMLEMHTKLWECLQETVPEFTQHCDVFRRVKTTLDEMEWSEDVPI